MTSRLARHHAAFVLGLQSTVSPMNGDTFHHRDHQGLAVAGASPGLSSAVEIAVA